MSQPSPIKEEKSFFQWIGSVLSFLLSLVRKAPLLVVALVVVFFFHYRKPFEESRPRFREPPERGPVLAPATPPSPEMGPVFRCVQEFDADLLEGRWRGVYLGVEVRPNGKQFTVAVTEKWQGLSLKEKEAMVEEVVATWVKNGQAFGLLGSAEELEAVRFKQSPSEQPVATWKPTSGPQVFILS